MSQAQSKFESTHDRFKERLRASEASERFVAEWLRRRGTQAVRTKKHIAERRAEWEENVDNGDLRVMVRAEVKTALSSPFSGPHDFPYRHYMVMGKNAYDRAIKKPFVFYMVSIDHRCVGIVVGVNPRHWYEQELPDPFYGPGYKQMFYCAHKKDVVFHQVEHEDLWLPQ